MSVLNGQLLNMVARFVLFPVLVAVAAIINTSTAESNESISYSPFGYELAVAGLDSIQFNMQKLNSKIEGLEKTVQRIETLVKILVPPQTCAEISNNRSGLYRIQPQVLESAYEVYCEQEYNGGGWLVIQNRYDGSVDFFRGWKEYEAGFGELRGEFWLGLKRIHELTNAKPHKLHIILEDVDGTVKTAQYDRFIVGGAETKYVLSGLGNYAGTAGDLLRHRMGMKFSTFDNDNDESDINCANRYEGAWWYDSCGSSNLNGPYIKGELPSDSKITWFQFIGPRKKFKRSRMMIRAVDSF